LRYVLALNIDNLKEKGHPVLSVCVERN
jgi:hypothetical protein